MPTVKLVIQLEIDNKPVAGFPLVRRLSVDEIQNYNYEEPNDGDMTTFSLIPADQLATIQALLIRSDKQVNIRLDGQTDAGILLSADGILLIIGATIDAGAGASNAKVNNNSGATAQVQGFAGGT